MEVNKIKKFSPLIFVVILICFPLPFVTFSCGGEKMITLSGIQLITGTDLEKTRPPGDMFRQPSFGARSKPERIGPEPFAIGAFTAAAIGLGLSFIRSRRSAIVPAIMGAITAGLLLALKNKIDSDVLREGEGALQVEYNSGFWLALLFSFLACGLNLFLFWKKEREIASNQDNPLSPRRLDNTKG